MMGYLDNDEYKLHQPKLRCPRKAVIYLTWDELMCLFHFDYGKQEYLAHTRDVFCLSAFTGLRYSDAEKVRWNDIRDNRICIITQKTWTPLRIELNRFSRSIIEKYRPKDTHDFDKPILPTISNQKMNIYLKDCAMLAQIDEPLHLVSFKGSERIDKYVLKWEVITTHCARRTFVVSALRLGIPLEVIMKWTGHSDFKAMKPYIDIVDELRERCMALFNRT